MASTATSSILAAAAALVAVATLTAALGVPARADDIELGAIRIAPLDGDLRGEEFRRNVVAGLGAMRDRSPHLARLLRAAQEAPLEIRVYAMMEDPSTHIPGEAYRPHARAIGFQSFGRGGVMGYPAAIYLSLGMVNPYWTEYKRGQLAHELTHAVDLAYGRMNPQRMVAERRAMFMENVWRDVHGWSLAEHYTDSKLPLFETLEYQRAKSRGVLARCVDIILTVTSFDCP